MFTKQLPTMSASELRAHTTEVLEKAQAQAIVITQHNRASAVLMSCEQYEDLTQRLAQLETLRDAIMLKHAQDHSEGVVSPNTLLEQFHELHGAPLALTDEDNGQVKLARKPSLKKERAHV